MKTYSTPPGDTLTDEEFHQRNIAWLDDFQRKPQAEKIALLVSLGVLTPEGKVPTYPMDDHVPYGFFVKVSG